jgi:hypothetical protein
MLTTYISDFLYVIIYVNPENMNSLWKFLFFIDQFSEKENFKIEHKDIRKWKEYYTRKTSKIDVNEDLLLISSPF